MASTVITAPELHEETDDVIRAKLLEYVPMFRQHMDRGAGDLICNLEAIIEHRLWSRVGYDSLEGYAREHLQHSERWCREIIRVYNQDWTPAQRQTGTIGDITAAVDLARAQADPESGEYVKRGNPTGANQHTSGNDLIKINSKQRRNHPGDKPGILRRLARSRPDLLDRIETGELTANAAAIEAGFRRPMKSVPVDSPESAVRALLKVFSIEDLVRAVGVIADSA